MSTDDKPFSLECHVCGKEILNAVECPKCDAINYCSIAHLKVDRPRHSEACHRLKAHKSARGLNDFPYFPWHPTDAQPSPCTLLKDLGFHKQGVWHRECPCGRHDAFGTKAPLLKDFFTGGHHEHHHDQPSISSAPAATKGGSCARCDDSEPIVITRPELAEHLKDWWGSEELAETANTLLVTSTTQARELPRSWESYCAQRPLPLSSPLPVVLDMPLTMLWAVDHLKARLGGLPQRLVLWCVGAEKEVDQWPLLLELGSLLPGSDITLHIMGPEVPCWADDKTIIVPHPEDSINHPDASYTSNVGISGDILETMNGSIEARIQSLPLEERQRARRMPRQRCMQLCFHQGEMQEVVMGLANEPLHHPDIIVGLNAGLGAYPSWAAAIYMIRGMLRSFERPRVCLFTDYVAESVYLSRQLSYVYLGPLDQEIEFSNSICKDPHGRPGERDLKKRLKMSKCEVNPFRKPRFEKQSTHSMPSCPNGFAFWLDFE
jgi:hypothetical protein